jgi:hypothetical protein
VLIDEPAPAPVVDIPLDEQVALRATIIIGEKRMPCCLTSSTTSRSG